MAEKEKSEKDKKVDNIAISKMNYQELVNLLLNNQDIEIKAGMLFLVLREFHKHMEKQYILELRKQIITPDKSIKDLNGKKI